MSRGGIPGVSIGGPSLSTKIGGLPLKVGMGQSKFITSGNAIGTDGMPRPPGKVYVGMNNRTDDQSVPRGVTEEGVKEPKTAKPAPQQGPVPGKGMPQPQLAGMPGPDDIPRYGKAFGYPRKTDSMGPQAPPGAEKGLGEMMKQTMTGPVGPNVPMPMARPDPFASLEYAGVPGMPEMGQPQMPDDIGAFAPDGAVHQGYAQTGDTPVIDTGAGIRAGNGGGGIPIINAIRRLFGG